MLSNVNNRDKTKTPNVGMPCHAVRQARFTQDQVLGRWRSVSGQARRQGGGKEDLKRVVLRITPVTTNVALNLVVRGENEGGLSLTEYATISNLQSLEPNALRATV